MVVAFVTAAFIVVVVIIGHICELVLDSSPTAVNSMCGLPKQGLNEIDINNLLCSLLSPWLDCEIDRKHHIS